MKHSLLFLSISPNCAYHTLIPGAQSIYRGEAANWYLEAGAADELDPVAAPEGRHLRRVVTGEAASAGAGYGGRCGPDGRLGGEERRRRHRDGGHGFSPGHFHRGSGNGKLEISGSHLHPSPFRSVPADEETMTHVAMPDWAQK